jgi:hypothetical protein
VRRASIIFVSLVGAVALLASSSSVRAVPADEPVEPPAQLEVCKAEDGRIEAADLPRVVEPESCSLEGDTIVDEGVGALVPGRGMSVYAEFLTPRGGQELTLTHREDGTVELGEVGEEAVSSDGFSGAESARRRVCSDPRFTDLRYRVEVEDGYSYRFNRRSARGVIGRTAATNAVRRGGRNIATTHNDCRMGDRNPAGVAFLGNTRRHANATRRACGPNDGLNVVSFGRLAGRRTLALVCTWSVFMPGQQYLVVEASDVRINRRNTTRWTVRPNRSRCRNRFDLESVMTHEFGHTFGLGDVRERFHPNLTMSRLINGPCQSSERTLGRGDVLGIEAKY